MSSEQFSGPWLPWFHGDFTRATLGWTLLERGAYVMLLGASWEIGPLPADKRRLASIIGVQLEELETVWPVVGPKFQVTSRGLVNPRLEVHRQTQAQRSERARQSAQVRWGGRSTTEPNATAGANGHANADANASRSHSKIDAKSMLLRSQNSDLRSQSSELRKSRAGARASRSPPSFHQEVIDAYHELCPKLTPVKTWYGPRQQLLNACIAERMADGKPANTIDYWRGLFEHFVAPSKFLASKSFASLGWLLEPKNFVKLIEGNYLDKAQERLNGERGHG
jgi:uncharacterized protein YdaU (DUF1376 family)